MTIAEKRLAILRHELKRKRRAHRKAEDEIRSLYFELRKLGKATVPQAARSKDLVERIERAVGRRDRATAEAQRTLAEISAFVNHQPKENDSAAT
jgi:seryl-tRNA synthetase